MNKEKFYFRGIFCLVALVLTFVFTGCPAGSLKDEELNSSSENAAAPVITTQPQGAIYFVGDTDIKNLSVSVKKMTDDDVLSLQWYSNTVAAKTGGTAIIGATGLTYALPSNITSEPKTYYFYVVATNTNTTMKNPVKTTTSAVAIVNVQTDVADISNAVVTVNTDQRYQYVRGFGGNDIAFDHLPVSVPADYETMFDPEKLGYNMVRIYVPTSEEYTDINQIMDELVTNKTYPEIDLSNYYKNAKIVNKYGGYIMASPWSPPAAWKTNDSIKGGGSLKKANYLDWADYLRTYCEIMARNGAPIYAVSLQNEYTWVVSYEGCEYGGRDNQYAENRDFWKTPGIGHFTSNEPAVPGYGGGKALPYVKIMGGESHNEVTPHDSALNDRVSRACIDIIGRHIYGTEGTSRYTYPLALNPKFISNPDDPLFDAKEVWMTEHNINSGEGGYENDSTWNYVWPFINEVDLTVRLNNESAFFWWVSKRFYGMIGDGKNGTIDGAILPRGYALSHYAKFAKETGRVGVNISGTLADGAPISASNVNQASFDTTQNKTNGGGSVKITAFVSFKRNDNSDWDDGSEWRRDRERVNKNITLDDITAISLVMYTPTNTSGSGGTNMGTIKIKLPDGFVIRNAEAVRSNASGQAKPETVPISKDRNEAYVSLPGSTILSVRFTK
ncbi:glycoside hydrolase [Treponema sp. R80B11-R83G3]